MPTAREALTAGVVDGILYEIGGLNHTALGAVEAYNPATDTWTTKTPMPTPRYFLASGVINGILYTVGGFDNNVVASSKVEAYDPATDSWTTKASMPTPRSGLAVGVISGILYAVGGVNQGFNPLNTVEAYDPSTNSWTTKASMPTARAELGVGVVDGKLYALGGSSSNRMATTGRLATVEAYDPTTDSWSTKRPMPTQRLGLAVASMDGKIFALGGYACCKDTHKFDAYDPATNAWTAEENMLSNSVYLVAGVVKTGSRAILYAAGGLSGANYLNTMEAFTPGS
ncbi:MAG TPA: kelch repeat-containing protein [Candidatus Eremiobacteraceae bacterium]